MSRASKLLEMISKEIPKDIEKEVQDLAKIVGRNKKWKGQSDLLVGLVGGERFPRKARQALAEINFIVREYPKVVQVMPKDILDMYKQIYALPKVKEGK